MIIRVVAAAIFNKTGQVLIARRARGQSGEGEWEFPGGKVEKGESDVEALVREIHEELNLSIKIGESLGSNQLHLSNKIIELVVYISEFDSGEVQLVDHDAYEWVELNQLLNFQLARADVPFVKLLQNKRS